MGLGSGPINRSRLVGEDFPGYKAQARRKSDLFQGLATQLPEKSARSLRDSQMALNSGVKPLNRITDTLFAAFLKFLSHLAANPNA
jgi:hypothetical protein